MISKNTMLVGSLLFSLACIGCGPGGPEIASVEGTVTMDGKPLANASIVFSPESGRPAGARTDAQGHYELNFTAGRRGAIPGMNRIRISTSADPSETPDGQPIPAQRETVPARYNSATELEFNVEPNKKNVANFDLTSEGKLPEADSMVEESLEKTD